MRMRLGLTASIGVAVACAIGAGPVIAQTVPTSVDQVARPGGKLPGDPKIALVKVADGFNDPTGVASAYDGSGRIFVVERVGSSAPQALPLRCRD